MWHNWLMDQRLRTARPTAPLDETAPQPAKLTAGKLVGSRHSRVRSAEPGLRFRRRRYRFRDGDAGASFAPPWSGLV